jgi:hypothetical protein
MSDPSTPDDGLYLVRYIDHAGVEREMTARPGGATRIGSRWIPVWELEPPNQLGHSPGSVRTILRYERIGE